MNEINPKPEYWVLSLSGGKDSTALGLEWLARHKADPVTYPLHEVVYCDTWMEFPAMMEHINQLEKIFMDAGIKFTRLKSEKSFEYLMFDHWPNFRKNSKFHEQGYSWPGPRSRWCTAMLKRDLIDRHLRGIQGKYSVIQLTGLAADERERLQRENNINHLHPLAEWGWTEADFMVEEEGQEPKGFNWTRIPLVPFKYNKQEIPLIRRVKTLQDGINTMISDFENNMQEDARNTILVLKNYDGENLGEFRHNLSTYGAVKVREDGGVETLQVEINAENYKGILELLKKSLIENARGYDAKDDRLSGNPNQMNIQSMYSDIDLDANGMETEFQAAFEELLWFINQDFSNRGLGDYEGAELQIVFNRDILINETESIENCAKSVGILSTETIVEQHPWVTDVEVELARLRKEKDEAMEQAQEYAGAFQTGNQNKGDNGEGE